MAITFHSPVDATYGELRYSLVKQVEGVELLPYINPTDTFATIGVGIQFETVPANRDMLFDFFGIGEEETAIRQQLTEVITTAPSSSALRSGLNSIMAQRAQSVPGARTEFAFANDQEARSTFDIIAPRYELEIDNRLVGVAESRERAVLYSLSHNNPGELLGANLIADISSGDRAEAFYEIRYASNGGAGGQEKRRYVESQIFGVFDNANPTSRDDVSVAEALSAFEMWTRHEQKIATYDSTHSAAMDLANGDLAVIGDNYGEVTDLATTLQPAKDRLFVDYADVNEFEDGLLTAKLIDAEYAGSLLRTTVDSVWVAPLTSTGGNEVAAHTVDRSDAGAVDDLIFGSVHTDGSDSGAADTLWGGAGDDFFVGSGGADTIDGGDGEDTVSYARSGSAVTVDLTSEGAQSGGDAAGDHLSNIENVIGSAFNDHFTVDGGSHVVLGLGGDDTVVGGSADDYIFGGLGNDYLHGGFGNDFIDDGEGVDYAEGGMGDDWFNLSDDSSADVVIVGLGDDYITGGDANDRLVIRVDQLGLDPDPDLDTWSSQAPGLQDGRRQSLCWAGSYSLRDPNIRMRVSRPSARGYLRSTFNSPRGLI